MSGNNYRIGAAALALSITAFAFPASAAELNGANTAWILTSTALVLFMTLPGLALFYGGLVQAKNVLSVLMHCFAIACMASVLWFVGVYSLAFDEGNAWIGGLGKLMLSGVSFDSLSGDIPESVFFMFQMTFAIITPALIVGAYVERIRFSAVLMISALWLVFVYAPVCHWVWGGGWLAKMGVMDFAGGLVVHATAGTSALVIVKMLGTRTGFPSQLRPPHSPGMTMIGAAMLWVGWFGFNAGSNLESNAYAGLAMLNTFLATAAAGVAWPAVEWILKGKPSLLGAASGVVAGLVAITPAAGFAGPMGAIVLGLVASPICLIFVSVVKNKLGYDDSLDVFGVHAIGGIVGAIGTGILVDPALGGAGIVDYAAGGASVYPGMATQVTAQLKGVLTTLVWSGIGSTIVFGLIKFTIGLRVKEEVEREGLDIAEHGERAYNM